MKIKDLFEKKNEANKQIGDIKNVEIVNNKFNEMYFGCSKNELNSSLNKIVGLIKELNKHNITARRIGVEVGSIRSMIGISQTGEISVLEPMFNGTSLPVFKIKNMNEEILKGKIIAGWTFNEGKHAVARFAERKLKVVDQEHLLDRTKKFIETVNYVMNNNEFSVDFFNKGFCFFKSLGFGFGFALNKKSKQIFITTFTPQNRNNFQDGDIYFEV